MSRTRCSKVAPILIFSKALTSIYRLLYYFANDSAYSISTAFSPKSHLFPAMIILTSLAASYLTYLIHRGRSVKLLLSSRPNTTSAPTAPLSYSVHTCRTSAPYTCIFIAPQYPIFRAGWGFIKCRLSEMSTRSRRCCGY